MPIELLPNQPFIFNQEEQDCDTRDGKVYCQLVNNNDAVRFQFKQTPCNDNLVSNPTLISGLGSELVSNGSFTGSASGWTLAGSPAPTYGANKVTFGGGSGLLTQAIGSITAGKLYRLTFTISGRTTGTLQPGVGVAVGVGLGEAVTTNGTFTQDIIAGAGADVYFNVIGDATFNGSIDNVSCKLITITGWTLDNNEVIVSGGGSCHIAGTATTFSQGGFTSGHLYQVVITVSNRTVGNVILNIDVALGLETDKTISANGEHTVYIQAGSTTLLMEMDADFDGCIDSIYVYELSLGYTMDLYDLNDTLVAHLDTQGAVFYHNEYVNLQCYFTQGKLLDIHGAAVPYGCYYMTINDTCTTEVICDNSFVGTDCTPDPWTLTAGAVISGGKLTFTGASTRTYERAYQNITVRKNTCYKLCYDIQNIDKSPVTINIGTYTLTIPAGTTGPACIQFSIPDDATRINISQDYVSGSGANIYSVSLKPCPSYTSNCLNWKESHSCSKLFYANQANISGFDFDTFVLSIRLRILAINPTYTQDEEDYLYSSGFRQITSSTSEKYWVIWFDYTDEISHDVIAALINCSSVFIDSTEVYFKKGTYAPEWDKDAKMKLAQSRIEGKSKGRTIFNTNCS